MKRKNKEQGDSLKDKKSSVTNVVKYSGLAFQMIAVILIVLYGGIKLDEVSNMEFPLFKFLGAIFGVVFALYFALKDFLKSK